MKLKAIIICNKADLLSINITITLYNNFIFKNYQNFTAKNHVLYGFLFCFLIKAQIK